MLVVRCTGESASESMISYYVSLLMRQLADAFPLKKGLFFYYPTSIALIHNYCKLFKYFCHFIVFSIYLITLTVIFSGAILKCQFFCQFSTWHEITLLSEDTYVVYLQALQMLNSLRFTFSFWLTLSCYFLFLHSQGPGLSDPGMDHQS